MKANDFVKKYGLTTFKISMGFVNTRKYLVVYTNEIDFTDEIKPHHGNCVFDRKEVKKIVEAHELVEKFGGLEESRKYINDRILPELGRAIKLVESCQ